MARHVEDYRRYLSPRVLAAMKGLELRARLIVEGFVGGMHHSPHRGLSIEFADHREYCQGDDIRHVDWKVYGKTDKYYIKEYEQETNLSVVLAVDASESMSFAGDDSALTKHEYATSVAAAIAYLSLRQHDSVGLAVFDERIRTYIKPTGQGNQWKTVIRELEGATGPASTSIARVLDELADRLSGRNLVVIVSDLFDEPEEISRGIQRLRFHRHDVVVFNVWDADELSLPQRGPVMFEGMEAAGNLRVEPDALRAAYVGRVREFQATLRRACSRMQVDYQVLDTSRSLDVALRSYLATRAGRLRQRSARVMGSS